jgi:hypothetical protein
MKQTTAKENIMALPDRCYSVLQMDGSLIMILAGENCYRPVAEEFAYAKRSQYCLKNNEELADKLNEILGVTRKQREAMDNGSMFGWEVPGANVENL